MLVQGMLYFGDVLIETEGLEGTNYMLAADGLAVVLVRNLQCFRGEQANEL